MSPMRIVNGLLKWKVIAVLAIVVAGVSVATAAVGDGGVIKACYDPDVVDTYQDHGFLYPVDSSATGCTDPVDNDDVMLTWNQQGPQGAPGAPGSGGRDPLAEGGLGAAQAAFASAREDFASDLRASAKAPPKPAPDAPVGTLHFKRGLEMYWFPHADPGAPPPFTTPVNLKLPKGKYRVTVTGSAAGSSGPDDQPVFAMCDLYSDAAKERPAHKLALDFEPFSIDEAITMRRDGVLGLFCQGYPYFDVPLGPEAQFALFAPQIAAQSVARFDDQGKK